MKDYLRGILSDIRISRENVVDSEYFMCLMVIHFFFFIFGIGAIIWEISHDARAVVIILDAMLASTSVLFPTLTVIIKILFNLFMYPFRQIMKQKEKRDIRK